MSDKEKLKAISKLVKQMLDCPCAGGCWDCIERLIVIGNAADVRRKARKAEVIR